MNQKQVHLTPQQIMQQKKLQTLQQEFKVRFKATIEEIKSVLWAGTFSDIRVVYRATPKVNGSFQLTRVEVNKPDYLSVDGLGQKEYDRIFADAIDIIRESITDAINAKMSEVIQWLNEELRKITGANLNFEETRKSILKETACQELENKEVSAVKAA